MPRHLGDPTSTRVHSLLSGARQRLAEEHGSGTVVKSIGVTFLGGAVLLAAVQLAPDIGQALGGTTNETIDSAGATMLGGGDPAAGAADIGAGFEAGARQAGDALADAGSTGGPASTELNAVPYGTGGPAAAALGTAPEGVVPAAASDGVGVGDDLASSLFGLTGASGTSSGTGLVDRAAIDRATAEVLAEPSQLRALLEAGGQELTDEQYALLASDDGRREVADVVESLVGQGMGTGSTAADVLGSAASTIGVDRGEVAALLETPEGREVVEALAPGLPDTLGTSGVDPSVQQVGGALAGGFGQQIAGAAGLFGAGPTVQTASGMPLDEMYNRMPTEAIVRQEIDAFERAAEAAGDDRGAVTALGDHFSERNPELAAAYEAALGEGALANAGDWILNAPVREAMERGEAVPVDQVLWSEYQLSDADLDRYERRLAADVEAELAVVERGPVRLPGTSEGEASPGVDDSATVASADVLPSGRVVVPGEVPASSEVRPLPLGIAPPADASLAMDSPVQLLGDVPSFASPLDTTEVAALGRQFANGYDVTGLPANSGGMDAPGEDPTGLPGDLAHRGSGRILPGQEILVANGISDLGYGALLADAGDGADIERGDSVEAGSTGEQLLDDLREWDANTPRADDATPPLQFNAGGTFDAQYGEDGLGLNGLSGGFFTGPNVLPTNDDGEVDIGSLSRDRSFLAGEVQPGANGTPTTGQATLQLGDDLTPLLDGLSGRLSAGSAGTSGDVTYSPTIGLQDGELVLIPSVTAGFDPDGGVLRGGATLTNPGETFAVSGGIDTRNNASITGRLGTEDGSNVSGSFASSPAGTAGQLGGQLTLGDAVLNAAVYRNDPTGGEATTGVRGGITTPIFGGDEFAGRIDANNSGTTVGADYTFPIGGAEGTVGATLAPNGTQYRAGANIPVGSNSEIFGQFQTGSTDVGVGTREDTGFQLGFRQNFGSSTSRGLPDAEGEPVRDASGQIATTVTSESARLAVPGLGSASDSRTTAGLTGAGSIALNPADQAAPGDVPAIPTDGTTTLPNGQQTTPSTSVDPNATGAGALGGTTGISSPIVPVPAADVPTAPVTSVPDIGQGLPSTTTGTAADGPDIMDLLQPADSTSDLPSLPATTPGRDTPSSDGAPPPPTPEMLDVQPPDDAGSTTLEAPAVETPNAGGPGSDILSVPDTDANPIPAGNAPSADFEPPEVTTPPAPEPAPAPEMPSLDIDDFSFDDSSFSSPLDIDDLDITSTDTFDVGDDFFSGPDVEFDDVDFGGFDLDSSLELNFSDFGGFGGF